MPAAHSPIVSGLTGKVHHVREREHGSDRELSSLVSGRAWPRR